MSSRRFTFERFRCEAAAALAGDPERAARRLLDPAAAERTLHWGRNYLYVARVELVDGPGEVVVKQFRDGTWRERLRRRLGGSSRARRSWNAARALAAAGISTPEPLLLVESIDGAGPSLFVSRFLPGRTEARYLLRARNAGSELESFPEIDFGAFLDAVAALARRLHEAGIWHRDLSIGNLLVAPGPEPSTIADVALIDLNRCRQRRRLSRGERLRDLCRLALERPEDRRRLLGAYFGRAPSALESFHYELLRRSFHGRHRLKPRLRAAWTRARGWLLPRGVHAHIPPPPERAGARDKIVWDRLSDQPHSHAGRLERAAVRIADLPSHLRSAAALLGAVPRILSAYRRLRRERNREPFPWPGAGVALRPLSAEPGAASALLDALAELGTRQALLRLHPWQAEHDAEERLARELAARGVELTFALPQSRELVRDPERWRRAVAELAERFTPYGRRFQVGQAINRSKWGIWNYDEYLRLAADAEQILRRHPGVELAGPAVIDFEAHVTAAVVNRRHPSLRFDALASLLYVDRRGAPENRQLGFDSAEKVTLLAAIAASSRRIGAPRQWITEVNWPLAEGPHSPAGRAVAVDEATQADYLVRFYLAALGGGHAERVFWWQLVARGYGLLDPRPDGTLRRRPAFDALATLGRELGGSLCLGPRPAPAGVRRWAFRRPDRGVTEVVWAPDGRVRLPLDRSPEVVVDRDGARRDPPADGRLEASGSPLYLRHARGVG